MDGRSGKPDSPSFKSREQDLEKNKGEVAPVDNGDALRRVVRNLEKAIERAIASSTQVEECLAQVRAQGYEVSLVLEATLGFARRGELNHDQVEDLAAGTASSESAFKMSSLDKKFLRSLKIAADDEGKGS